MCGAALQAVAGMGMGLVCSSILSMLLGPLAGIMLLNVLALLNAAWLTISQVKHVDWRRFWLIGPLMLVGAISASWVIKTVSTAWLELLVGVSMVLALGVATQASRLGLKAHGKTPALVTGVIAGFMNTVAGISAPAITVYALAARWDYRFFAATLQPLFVVGAAFSAVTKMMVGGVEFPTTWTWWVAGCAGMVLGLFVGAKLRARVAREHARLLALAIATIGCVIVLIRGALGVLAGH